MPLPNSLPTILLSLTVGAGAGLLYFGGLWWTVNRMPTATRPTQLYFGSLGVRLACLLAVFYGIVTAAGWPGAVSAVIGLVFARLLMTRYVTQSAVDPESPREVV